MITLTADEINRMSSVERLTLIGDLWDSLSDAEVPLPAAQGAELERRLESFDAEVARAVTWEQFKATLNARPA